MRRICMGAHRYSFSDANTDGMQVKIKCHACSITHCYRPADLITVCGDVQLEEIAAPSTASPVAARRSCPPTD